MLPNSSKGIDLSMGFTIFDMIALANDSVATYEHSPHHGVGLCQCSSVFRQLKAAAHVHFVNGILVDIHIFIIFVVMKSYQQLWSQLTPFYDETEAKALIRTVLEVRYGMSLTDIICGKVSELSTDERQSLQEIILRLQRFEPVQYILGVKEFGGRTFHVSPGVLIPRDETAELCRWIIDATQESKLKNPTILDIGTGSGCIAITLSLEIQHAQVAAWDVSTTAIQVASQNARDLGAAVSIVCQDALNTPKDSMKWDIIVSNPPYICPNEMEEMEPNVLSYEPKEALFVPENHPLLFYDAIAHYAKTALKSHGKLYFEINPLYRTSVVEMLKNKGFIGIMIRKDTFGKERMVCATEPDR